MQQRHPRLATCRRLWRLSRGQSTPMTTSSASAAVFRACDAHCHLHDERFRQALFEDQDVARVPAIGRLDAVMQRAAAAGVTHVVSCACHREDWEVLERLLAVQQAVRQRASGGGQEPPLEVVPCFGLHPWWAMQHVQEEETAAEGPLVCLRGVLLRYPNAGLGEIGLCKSARGRQVPADVQLEALRAQLALAAELERTCVVHCVGQYGRLLEVLAEFRRKRQLPPRIVLHSYSGSPDMIPAFLALSSPAKGMLNDSGSVTRFFFSLNARQLTDSKSTKAATCCTTMPLSSLLLETDAPDQPPTLEAVQSVSDECALDVVNTLRVGDTLLAAGLNEPMVVQLAVHRAACMRMMSVEELACAVFQNSRDAFGF